MLAEHHPLPLLHLVSGFIAVADRHPDHPFGLPGDEGPGVTLSELVTTFLAVRLRESTALLTALAPLVADDLLGRRIRSELATRHHRLPAWLERLEPLTAERAVVVRDVFGDGDNIMIEARTGAGSELTVIAYVDHNLGTLVKDAFVLPAPLDLSLGKFREAQREYLDTFVEDLPLADARARVSQAIELGEHTFPPLDTETWPITQALIEWVLRQLPDGGAGFVRPDWPDEAREDLTARFLASSHGTGLDDQEDADVLGTLLSFACDYGPSDPLRWSPAAVEILLADWLPRKVVADRAWFRRVPEVLRRLIRFSHAERGLRAARTAETLGALDHVEPLLWTALESEPEHLFNYEEWVRRLLLDTVGEADLAGLDAEPLPAEPLDLSGVPEDLHARLGVIARLVDAGCGDLLDAEYRTIGRRLLHDVAAASPVLFGSRARSEVAAAAIVWTELKANLGLGQRQRQLSAKELGAWFGVGDPNRRPREFIHALGHDIPAWSDGRIGTARYLVAERRRWAAQMRDQFLSPV